MAKESHDRTTIDLFATEKTRGRPKTNPLSRSEQLVVNKRNQIKRDRAKGLKRIELKVDTELFEALNQLAEQRQLSRSQVIESMLVTQIKDLAQSDAKIAAEEIEVQNN